MNQSFFSQLIARLTSETPIFFKKIVLFGITLGTIGTGLKVSTIWASLPASLQTLSGYFISIGVVCAVVAKATTTDPNLQATGGSNVVVNQSETPPVSTEAPVSPPIPKV